MVGPLTTSCAVASYRLRVSRARSVTVIPRCQLIVDYMRAGVSDFVSKSNLARLRPAVEAAIAQRRRLERLTPRKVEVLRLLSAGHSTSEIARRLQLSIKTIETHRMALMNRLGIHDLAGLIRFAIHVGLVPLEP